MSSSESTCIRYFWGTAKGREAGVRGYRAVHQGALRVELVEQVRLQRRDVLEVDGPCPDVGDLPDVDLPVGDHVASGAGEVALNPRPDAVCGLADVYRHLVHVAEGIAAHWRRDRRYLTFPVTDHAACPAPAWAGRENTPLGLFVQPPNFCPGATSCAKPALRLALARPPPLPPHRKDTRSGKRVVPSDQRVILPATAMLALCFA